jgi:hypothetical protein
VFSAFVNIFFVLLLEVGHGIVSDLAEEGVLMDRTLVVYLYSSFNLGAR